MRVPLSILDLAPIARGQSASDSFANSVALAQRAEELGYPRVWYAEHHNIASIASSATSVLIAHVGAFHAWIPGQWVHHPCREDSYRGLITSTGPDQWRTRWEVDGPDKAQRIITRLAR